MNALAPATGVLAFPSTSVAGPDAEIVAMAAEFCRRVDHYETLNFDTEPGTPEDVAHLRECEVRISAFTEVGEQMLKMPVSTPIGLAALAMVMGRNDGDHAFSYAHPDDGLGPKLLVKLLADGHALATGGQP